MKHGWSRSPISLATQKAINFVSMNKAKLLLFLLHVSWTIYPCHVVAFSAVSHGLASSSYAVQSILNSKVGCQTKSHSVRFQVPSTRSRLNSFFLGPLFSQCADNDARKSPRRDQLVRVIDSILYYSEADKDQEYVQSNGSHHTYSSSSIITAPAPALVQRDHERFLKALKALKSAKHPSQVSQIGRLIQKELPTILEEEPRAIQERLLKVLSMAGLIQQAQALLEGMLLDTMRRHADWLPSSKEPQPRLPSYMSYTALYSALRKAGRIGAMEKLLNRMAEVAVSTSGEQIHVVALNIYLAALCDPLRSATSLGKKYFIKSDNLQKAWTILKDSELTRTKLRVQLATTSYNTVLTAAARAGNRTLVDEIWGEFVAASISWPTNSSQSETTSPIRPDIRSYNARLMVTPQAKRLAIWQEIQDQKDLLPDRYTIDSLLVPLLRNGQSGEAKALVEAFVSPVRNMRRQWLPSKSEIDSSNQSARITAVAKANSHALSAFLTTLVQKGEVGFAQELFDSLIRPNLPLSSTSGTALTSSTRTEPSSTMLIPTSRHFNILIDGYKRQATGRSFGKRGSAEFETLPTTSVAGKATNVTQTAEFQAQKLFELMQKNQIPIDGYTVTSMMGLCRTTQELMSLLKLTTNNRNASLAITPVIIRAAVRACGRLGDMACAVAIFDHFVLHENCTMLDVGNATRATSLSVSSSSCKNLYKVKGNTRIWNVLLGALAEGSRNGNERIEMGSFNDAMIEVIQKKALSPDETIGDLKSIAVLVDGKTCAAAVLSILNIMRDKTAYPWAPVPNSQSYCISASALQHDPSAGPELAMEIFRNATESEDIPADGRFVNAVFHCFGDHIQEAIVAWKTQIRQACVAYEKRPRREPLSRRRPNNKNLIAAYSGMLYVSGRALRPDIALRLVYAMKREGIEPNQSSMYSYQAGKRRHKELESIPETETKTGAKDSVWNRRRSRLFPSLLPQRRLVQQYENLLYVECTKYDEGNRHMAKDRRVRIIV